MYLAGTVAIPSLPAKALLTFEKQGNGRDGFFLVRAEQNLSAKVTISRTFFAEDVRAIFEPNKKCDKDGTWTAGAEAVTALIKVHLGEKGFSGVIYVREDAQSLIETKAGLSAAESAEYYPPMPQERSANHYDLRRIGCLHDECCDYPPVEPPVEMPGGC